jgi:4,5-DOPA dioxygenase extradiol
MCLLQRNITAEMHFVLTCCHLCKPAVRLKLQNAWNLWSDGLTQQAYLLDSGHATASPLPVLFLGHGSPMNAIEDNEYHRSWVDMGALFGSGQRWPTPKLILCVSAHWLTNGWQITANENPRTIHDFGGFPQALFDQQYPAPGDPAAAKAIAALLSPSPDGKSVTLSSDWGLDHGSWSVLKPMFPQAQIPVLQLSMDYARPTADHFALGRQLQTLRRQGVLIVASGNTVHNLRAIQMHLGNQEALDWARSFDDWVAERISAGEREALVDFQQRGQEATLAHPSFEHFLPLLYAAGAATEEDKVSYFNTGFQLGSIAMRSVVWDSV